MLAMVKMAMNSGAAGVCMGRQVFAHESPKSVAKALMMIVHDEASVDDAMTENGLL